MTTEPAGDEQDEIPSAPPRNDAAKAALLLITLLAGALAYIAYGPDEGPNFIAGFAIAVVIPFTIGGLGSTAFDPPGANGLTGCIGIPTALLVGLTLVVWLIAGEGAICIAMILLLWVPVAIGGALVNRWLRWRRRHEDDDRWRLRLAAWTALPALALAIDATLPMAWQDHAVTREVIPPSAPDDIWPLLLTIPSIGADEGQWTLTHDLLGVPRPSHAELVQGEGMPVRKAMWGSDVRFDERITDIRPGRSIGWKFAFPDDSVQRRTDRHIAPSGSNLRILSGRYDLVEIGAGCTQLRLTTLYAARTRFDGYFAAWGERLLGDVQSNVLAIIAGRVRAGSVGGGHERCVQPLRSS